MFTVNELATAAEERLALPVIVWNNDALQAIVEQMDQRQIPRIGVEPKSPDFVGPGGEPRLPRHPRRERRALGDRRVRAALAADRPTLIEIREDSPWLDPGVAGGSASRAVARADAAPGSDR